MKRKITKLLSGMAAMCLIAVTVQAGEINSAEQKVVNAVSQSFEYAEKSYVIKSSNLAEGKAKLAEDGVNLTLAEANSYIAQFHDSYEELVEEGYCDEVGGEEEGQSTKQTAQPSEHSQAEKKRNKEFLRLMLGDPADSINEGEDSKEKTEQNAVTVSKESPISEWQEEEDLGTALEFSDRDVQNAKSGVLEIRKKGMDYTINYGRQNSKHIIYPILNLSQWKIALCGVISISLIFILGMIGFIVRIKNHKHKRRKLRCSLAVGAGVSIAGWALLLILAFGLYFGVFNKEAIHRQLMESDYYSGVTQMARELASEQLTTAGYQKEIATEVFSLSNVYIEAKQYIDAVLSGKENVKVSIDTIHDKLTAQINQGETEQDALLIHSIEDTYTSLLQFDLGKEIKDRRDSYMILFYITIGVGGVMLLALFVLMYQMYGYPHKAVRVGAAGILVSSVLVVAVSLFARICHVGTDIQADPVYYQQFIQKYITWDITVLFYIGCIGILISGGLFIWKRYLHMIYAD